MTLADMVEVAVPIIDQSEDTSVVTCAECGLETTAMTIAQNGYTCPDCGSNICVMCGCTDQYACEGGCYWLSPGICSSHSAELQQMAAKVFGGMR